MKNKLVIVLIVVIFWGCNSNVNKTTVNSGSKVSLQQPETNIDSLRKWVHQNLETQSIEVEGDTLKLISADFYFYYPFGKYDNISSIQSNYPFLKLQMQVDTTLGYADNLYKLTFKNSFIKFIKNDDTKRMEIVYAKILDGRLVSLRGLRVGLRKETFLKSFFSKQVYINKINNIKIISALDGINHNYHFDADTLASIIIDTDYQCYKF